MLSESNCMRESDRTSLAIRSETGSARRHSPELSTLTLRKTTLVDGVQCIDVVVHGLHSLGGEHNSRTFLRPLHIIQECDEVSPD